MTNMQVFRNGLSETAKGSDKHQHRMVQLTQISRTQVLDAVSAMNWFIWNDKPVPSA